MEQATSSFESLASQKRSSSSTWIIVILIIVLIGLGWWWSKGMGGGLVSTTDDYRAIFLTNNQVYFGKLAETRGDYAILTDIFYLQVAQPLQPSEPNANPNVNLVKLGSELHGPTDRMEINRDQILFIETLKADSQVVKGIEQHKASQTPNP